MNVRILNLIFLTILCAANIPAQAFDLSIEPKLIDFGVMKKNQIATRDFIVKNNGSTKVTVTGLQFKKGGVGVFRILPPVSLPFDLDAQSSRTFTIEYTSSNEGEIADSLGITTTTGNTYLSKVKAQTGEPIIEVSDINFGSVVVNTTSQQKQFRISNRGTVKLTVSTQSGLIPGTGDQTTFDITEVINSALPLVIDNLSSGNNTKKYTVSFHPKVTGIHRAIIVFSSDAVYVDSVCVLNGTGVPPGLSVNNVDFGRCRVGGEYSKDEEGVKGEIILTNSGTSSVRINAATLTGDQSEFTITDADINSLNSGLTIAPSQEFRVPLGFKPTTTQHDAVRIAFNTDNNTTIVFEALGTGVIPRLSINDVQFRVLSLNGGLPVDDKMFNITNLNMFSFPAWEFYDDALITDIVEVGGGRKIGDGGPTDIGTERFSFDKTQLALPLKLKAGQVSASFDAWYQPILAGHDTAQLQTVSDAETEPISTWNGAATGSTDVEDEVTADFSISPSPAQDWVEVQCGDRQERSIVIFNILGVELRRVQTSCLIQRIDISTLAPGLYIVRSSDNQRAHSRVFTKY